MEILTLFFVVAIISFLVKCVVGHSSLTPREIHNEQDNKRDITESESNNNSKHWNSYVKEGILNNRSNVLFFKPGIAIISIILLGWIIVEYHKDILPFVKSEEYYVVTNSYDFGDIKTIHSNYCPLRHSAWFKRKHSKYNFVLEKDTYICDQCFDEDEAKKMLMLHSMNLQSLYERYRRYYSDEKTDSLLRAEYNTNANMREVYYGE